MSEPTELRPSLRKADLWPMSALDTALLSTFAYVVLLIGLVVGRHGQQHAPVAQPAPHQASVEAAVLAVADQRLIAAPPQAPAPQRARAAQRAPAPQQRVAAPKHRAPAAQEGASVSSCVTARTRPQSYAGGSGVEQRLAFGPPVEPVAPLRAAQVNGELWRRLCGGAGTPGGPSHRPDRRLYLAIDAAVNGRDPNRTVSQAGWAAGVERFIVRDAQWGRSRVVSRTVPAGTATLGMRVRPGADPLVLRTRLSTGNTSRYLVLPVRTARGGIVTLSLRLPCGFQPTF